MFTYLVYNNYQTELEIDLQGRPHAKTDGHWWIKARNKEIEATRIVAVYETEGPNKGKPKMFMDGDVEKPVIKSIPMKIKKWKLDLMQGKEPEKQEVEGFLVVYSEEDIPEDKLQEYRWTGTAFEEIATADKAALSDAREGNRTKWAARETEYQNQKEEIATKDFNDLTKLQKQILVGKKVGEIAEADWKALGK